MRNSLRTGICFGLTSGIITTLGLMIGLSSSTNSKTVVLGGILTIAVADAFSDALGIHISEESKNKESKEIWESTIFTFFAKFLIALSFVFPVMFLTLSKAVLFNIIYGTVALCVLSFLIAKSRKENPLLIILEHLFISCIVILIAHYLGIWISQEFV